MSFQHSKAWDSFENSDYAKKVVAGLNKKAEQADSEKHPNPASAPHELAKKAPTGRIAKVLVRMTKIAEAWENSGDERLQPYVQELDDIISSAMEEHATPAVQAALGLKKKVTKAQEARRDLARERQENAIAAEKIKEVFPGMTPREILDDPRAFNRIAILDLPVEIENRFRAWNVNLIVYLLEILIEAGALQDPNNEFMIEFKRRQKEESDAAMIDL